MQRGKDPSGASTYQEVASGVHVEGTCNAEKAHDIEKQLTNTEETRKALLPGALKSLKSSKQIDISDPSHASGTQG